MTFERRPIDLTLRDVQRDMASKLDTYIAEQLAVAAKFGWTPDDLVLETSPVELDLYDHLAFQEVAPRLKVSQTVRLRLKTPEERALDEAQKEQQEPEPDEEEIYRTANQRVAEGDI